MQFEYLNVSIIIINTPAIRSTYANGVPKFIFTLVVWYCIDIVRVPVTTTSTSTAFIENRPVTMGKGMQCPFYFSERIHG